MLVDLVIGCRLRTASLANSSPLRRRFRRGCSASGSMRVVSTRSYRFCGASRFRAFTDAAAAPASNSPAVAARGTNADAGTTDPNATDAQAVPNSEGGCGGVVSSKAATSVDDPAVATSTCSPAVTSAVSVDPVRQSHMGRVLAVRHGT